MATNIYRVSCRLNEQTNDWLTKRAESSGISKSKILQLALEDYVRVQEAKASTSDIEKLTVLVQDLQREVNQLRAEIKD